MSTQRWLVSWIGRTDHEAAESTRGPELGPIATAVKNGSRAYDRIYLLTNYPHDRSLAYCNWLSKLTGFPDERIDLFDIDLPSPIDYDAIYREVSKNLAGARPRLPSDSVELTFHLSPGTPAMAVVWVILAKTRFPAKLLQTAPDGSVLDIPFLADITSDFLPEFLQRSTERIERLSGGPAEAGPEFQKILHRCTAMASQVALARKAAAYDVPVLILGETGTGKELFAQAIHAASSRARGPFIAVNCGAISPELANSELFGHAKGAFTDAKAARKGHFVEASGGTLFLDEIGDLPFDTQVRLLRVLQAREVTPVGSSTPVPVDVRIIAATHRDLAADVAVGRFREDLFHRLAVGILRLPALRERDDDLELLIDSFLAQINADARGKPEAQECWRRLKFDPLPRIVPTEN
ncbi:MAG: RNA repair transcriptional activator RtcR family protein [Betaproteobacteria bacterium]|jgi:sigma54-dependent transcription regulator|nr:RNA repair transcriptional activator RtcR family protein [Rubrivivax sp.]